MGRSRYTVVMSDGTRVSGDKLTGWHAVGGAVRLDGAVIKAPGKQLLWIGDTKLKRWRPPARRGAYIEFVGGDRIVGAVIGGQDAAGQNGLRVPSHMLVRPTARKYTRDHQGVSLDIVRVLPDRIRRVVLTPGLGVRFRPGSAFDRDGRRMSFVSIRWRGQTVRLLTKTASRTVQLADLAEIHMPRMDPWEAYYRQLAIISPACRSNLIRLETTDGMIATGSESRFGAAAFSHESMLPHAIAHRRNLVSHIKHLQERYLKSRRKFEETRTAQQKRIAELTRLGQAKDALVLQMARSAATAEQQHETYQSQLASGKARLAVVPGHAGDQNTWWHMVHPVWSLDPLWVPFKTIVMRWESRPDTVPLSRVEPMETVGPELLRWRADRNVDGGPLRSGGRFGGWGFGVHAHSELRFRLPSTAAAFSTRLGLDRVAGAGGCVRGKIFIGSTRTKPAYQSPVLIGSRKTVMTPAIPIPRSGKEPIDLILQADPVGRDHPAHAEPLNIRDKLDWLEPQLVLDPKRLLNKVRPHIPAAVLAWRGWTPTFDPKGVYQWRSWMARPESHERESFLPVLRVGARALRLSREITIAAGDKWLVVDVGFTDGSDIRADAVSLRIGDSDIQPEKLPVRQYWRRRTAPLVFSLAKYRGKKIKLELTQKPGPRGLYWRAVAVSSKLPNAHRLARFLVSIGREDMQVTRGLGLALQSGGIGKSDALSALKIMERGGTIGFCCKVDPKNYGYMHCVMVGHGWIGGEKTFRELKDVGWLRFLIICQENGFPMKLMKEVAEARRAGVWRPRRTPSTYGGIRYDVTLRNRSGKNLAIFEINRGGGLNPVDQVEPGGVRKLHAHEGYRYEAYVVAKKYDKSQPVSRVLVRGDAIWKIE
jgi:hypothetical protein